MTDNEEIQPPDPAETQSDEAAKNEYSAGQKAARKPRTKSTPKTAEPGVVGAPTQRKTKAAEAESSDAPARPKRKTKAAKEAEDKATSSGAASEDEKNVVSSGTASTKADSNASEDEVGADNKPRAKARASTKKVPKIVSARWDLKDGYTLQGYLRTGGYKGLEKALTMTPEAIVEDVKEAVLQGRGGAGFPAGAKWGFLPPGNFPRYLVINGDESEPGTYKDRILLERDPHEVLEGVLITAYAIRAEQAFIYIRGEMPLAHERMIQAVNDAYKAGYVGRNVLGKPWGIDVVVHWGAGAYIVGEETALIESLEGNRGMPRLKPPYFPAVKGLYMQPTVVNNVETMANIPWVISNGGSAFAAIGGENSRGTRLFALSGHVNKPGVYEVELGKTTFRDLVEKPEYGAGMRNGNALKAFIPGGASAPWFYQEHLDIPLSVKEVGDAGSMLGSGAIVVMDETTDAVRAAWRVVMFFAKESCGKCTPCREGTTWLRRIYERILSGNGRPADIELLLDVADNISPGLAWPPRQTTICPLGPSAASPIASSIRRFRDEYEAYVAKAESSVEMLALR